MKKQICCHLVLAGTLTALAGCSRNPSATAPQVGVNPPLTKTQTLGVDLVKAFQSDPQLSKTSISVGTGSNMVTLDGKVASASAKEAAVQIAKDKAPGYRIINRLVIAAASPTNKEKLKKPASLNGLKGK